MGQEERLALIVRDVDRGDAEPPLQLPQLDAHPLAQLCIEVRERLVEEQDLRTAHQRPREREALLLPPGELRRGAFLEPLEADQRERVLDHAPRVGFRRRMLGDAEWERDVV